MFALGPEWETQAVILFFKQSSGKLWQALLSLFLLSKCVVSYASTRKQKADMLSQRQRKPAAPCQPHAPRL